MGCADGPGLAARRRGHGGDLAGPAPAQLQPLHGRLGRGGQPSAGGAGADQGRDLAQAALEVPLIVHPTAECEAPQPGLAQRHAVVRKVYVGEVFVSQGLVRRVHGRLGTVGAPWRALRVVVRYMAIEERRVVTWFSSLAGGLLKVLGRAGSGHVVDVGSGAHVGAGEAVSFAFARS